MKIKLSYITEKKLKELPEWTGFPYSCKYCSYWESPQEFQARGKDEIRKLMKTKSRWLKNVRNDFGECATIMHINDKPVGYSQFSPPEFLPNLMNYPLFPNPDAILISCLFIFENKNRRKEFGTVFLNAVAENLENRNIHAIETLARKSSPQNPAGPIEFYLKNEFIIYKDDKEFPLMRFDL